MRGTPKEGNHGEQQRRIIPAYAGNTGRPRACRCRPGDHPRVCGEHTRVLADIDQQLGSSPRMRGTPTAYVIPVGWNGIIPAYAGNTSSSPMNRPARSDHPRVCGEHSFCSHFCVLGVGSSPRMRGTLAVIFFAAVDYGIIPAYAGNTLCVFLFPLSVWDHPRVCGEHASSHLVFAAVAGSSPRMRGTLVDGDFMEAEHGIIPAYAGNTYQLRGVSKS